MDQAIDQGECVRASEFVRLFTQSAREIYGYIMVLLPDENAADDVFQETSATLWEKFADFELGTDFFRWAKQIAYYKVLHYRDRKRREGIVFFGDDLVVDLAVQSSSPQNLRQGALSDCMNKLPPRDREILDRRYAPGASTAQVARDLGRSVHFVYRALRRIHQTLLECMRRTLQKEGAR